MPLPTTGKQVDKLSERLRRNDEISDADFELIEAIVVAYQAAMTEAQQRLRVLGYDPTTRAKTTPVLIDKLRRERSSIKKVQDIAGARIVEDCHRARQDEIVAEIVEEFEHAEKPPKVVDRRETPSHGYRAVHVIVTVQDLPVEIQVRTVRQDQWAQITEALGDRWGRGVRYGEGPPNPDTLVGPDITRGQVWHLVQHVAERLDNVERAELIYVTFLATFESYRELASTPEEHAEVQASLDDLQELKDQLDRADQGLKDELALLARLAPKMD